MSFRIGHMASKYRVTEVKFMSSKFVQVIGCIDMYCILLGSQSLYASLISILLMLSNLDLQLKS